MSTSSNVKDTIFAKSGLHCILHLNGLQRGTDNIKKYFLFQWLFHHLILKSSIYRFVKTASEELFAKLHNYAK